MSTKKKPKSTSKKPKNLGGRPAKKIDLVHLKKLAQMMFTEEEMAIALRMSWSTFKVHKQENLAEVTRAIDEGYANGRSSLRRRQMTLALKGDKTMLIWLGKQHLGQKEKMQHTGEIQSPIAVVATTLNFATAEEAAAAFEKKLRES